MASFDNTASQPVENQRSPEDMSRSTSLSQEANSLHSSGAGSRGADTASMSGVGGADSSAKGQMDTIHAGFDNTAGLYNQGGSAGDKGSGSSGVGHAGPYGASDAGSSGAHGSSMDSQPPGAGASDTGSVGANGYGASDAGSVGANGYGASDAGSLGANGSVAYDSQGASGGPPLAGSSIDGKGGSSNSYDGGYGSSMSGASTGTHPGAGLDSSTYSANVQSANSDGSYSSGAGMVHQSYASSGSDGGVSYSGTSDGRMPQTVTMEHTAGMGSDSTSDGRMPQTETMERTAGMGSDSQITDLNNASTSTGADSAYKPYDLSAPSGNSSLPPLEITDGGAPYKGGQSTYGSDSGATGTPYTSDAGKSGGDSGIAASSMPLSSDAGAGDGGSGDGKNGGDNGGQPSPYAERAQEILDKARAVEPDVTRDIQSLAGATGGEPVGLDHRLKTQDSLARKLETEKTSDVNDALRYTIAYSPENLAEGANKTMNQLEEKGYQKDKVKNTFTQENAPYKGINTTFSKGDQQFEVQFHTPESFDVKTNTHKLYDIRRDLPAHNDGSAATGDAAAAKAKQYIGHVKNEPHIDNMVTELATSKGINAAKAAEKLHHVLNARSTEMNARIQTPRDIHTVKNYPPKRDGGEGQF